MLLESRTPTQLSDEVQVQLVLQFLNAFASQEPTLYSEFASIARLWHTHMKALATTQESPLYVSGGSLVISAFFGVLEKMDSRQPFEIVFLFTLVVAGIHGLPMLLSAKSGAQEAQVAGIKELERDAQQILRMYAGSNVAWPIKDILAAYISQKSL